VNGRGVKHSSSSSRDWHGWPCIFLKLRGLAGKQQETTIKQYIYDLGSGSYEVSNGMCTVMCRHAAMQMQSM
jgi:hypothetical protein